MNSRTRLAVSGLEERSVPAALAGVPANAVAIAPDDGGIPRVRLVNPATGADIADVQAYEDAFRGGVHAALGDVTGDGVRDLVIAPGKGGGPRVRILDGATGGTLADFFVYEPTYTGGVYVALGDVNGDGRADIVTGTGVGGGPRVRVLDGATLGQRVLKDYFAYEPSFRGGVQVAAGDVNADGRADVVTGTGVGGGPRVVVFDGRDDRVLKDFFAYESGFRGGVNVAAGDLDGDGRADVFVGSGVGGGPVARVVSGSDDRELVRVLADDAGFRGGVRVTADDANADGFDDLVTRVRRGNDDVVRVTDGRTGGFAGGVVRTVDDNPSPHDQAERAVGGGATAPAGASVFVEGTVTAVDPAAGTVGIRSADGTVTTVRAGAGTEVKRHRVAATLAAFVVGDTGEALVGPDGVAVEIEGRSVPVSGGGSSGGGGHSGGGQTESRVEGTATAVDPTARTVTVRTQAGAVVVVRVGAGAKVERNGREVALAAFRPGDAVEARVGADGLATKMEARG